MTEWTVSESPPKNCSHSQIFGQFQLFIDQSRYANKKTYSLPGLPILHIHDEFLKKTKSLNWSCQKAFIHTPTMDSFDRFSETQLPPKEAFFNDLTDSHISEEDYERAQKIWRVFGCQTLFDYSTIYVKSDVALLPDVYISFCKLSMQDYGLDPRLLYIFAELQFSVYVALYFHSTGSGL